MATPQAPEFWPMALGDSADTVEIPDTTPAGEGIPSFTSLFPILTQIDPTAGGVFIQRTWMNALFQLLGNNIWYLQHGCLFPWNSSFDYPSGAHVLGSDSHEYVAVQESTGQDPTQDDDATYWARTASSPDGVTIVNAASGKLTAQDVAIGGDTSALASTRGQIGNPYPVGTNQDLNTFLNSGLFFVNPTGTTPLPEANRGGVLAVFRMTSFFVVQIFYTYNSNSLYKRYTVNAQNWSDWYSFITDTDIGDGITVNNGIISVPEYEGATASAPATSGLVPPAAAGQQGLYLSGGGEWDDPAAALRQAMIGMIAPFASTNLPEGWMACDGSSVLFADWPEFQTAYTAGRFSGMTVSSSTPAQVGKLVINGSSGVYLPDLEGLFVQASASGTAGAYVAPGLPNIKGSINIGASGGSLYPLIADNPVGALGFAQDDGTVSLPSTETRTGQYGGGLVVNASAHNAIYSDSINTVQPPAVQYTMAIYLGKPAA